MNIQPASNLIDLLAYPTTSQQDIEEDILQQMEQEVLLAQELGTSPERFSARIDYDQLTEDNCRLLAQKFEEKGYCVQASREEQTLTITINPRLLATYASLK